MSKPSLYVDVDGEQFQVETIRLKPGDKVVFSTDQRLSMEAAEQIKRRAKDFFPDNQVLVVQGMSVMVQEEK